jgi:hypothetical protein
MNENEWKSVFILLSIITIIISITSITLVQTTDNGLTQEQATLLKNLADKTGFSDSGCFLAECFSDQFIPHLNKYNLASIPFQASKGIVSCTTLLSQTMVANSNGLSSVEISSDGVVLSNSIGVSNLLFGSIHLTSQVNETLDIQPGLIQSSEPLLLNCNVSLNDNTTFEVGHFTTTLRLALNPSNGTIVYDTDLLQVFFYQGNSWVAITSGIGIQTVVNDGTGVGIYNPPVIGTTLHLNSLTHDSNVTIAPASGGNIQIGTNATSNNTINTIVLRDGTNSFQAGTVSLITSSSVTAAAQSKVTGDTNQRFLLSTDGTMLWGTGSAVGDTTLSRSGINVLTTSGNFIVTGSEFVAQYEVIGSITTPLNTTNGDVTARRLMIGTDTLLSRSRGKFAIINGTEVITAPDPANTTVIGISLSPIFAPTFTLSGGLLTGTNMTSTLSGNNAVTSPIIGASAMTILTGSGDMSNICGLYASSMISGNSASNHGLLVVSVSAGFGGSGYNIGDILSVSGGTGGTITVATLVGSAVSTITITHPGSGYGVPPLLNQTTTALTGSGTGAQVDITGRGSTSISASYGLQAQGISGIGTFVTPTVTLCSAIQIVDSNTGSGPITLPTQNGVDISNLTAATGTNTGMIVRAFTGGTGGTIGTNLGINILGFTGAAISNVGIRIAESKNAGTLNTCLQFVTQSTASSGGMLFGSGADAIKANLYRSGAGLLRTDGEFQALHFLCTSLVPTIAGGTGLGTGAINSITGTDAGMQISFTVAGSPLANLILFIVTYNVPYSSTAQFVVYSPANAAAASIAVTQTPFVSVNTAATFTFRSNTAGALVNGTYIFNFSVRA